MSDLQLRLVEALAGQYTIDREIGRGALACVYLAEERKHRRRVAIKVLRPELTASLSSARFHREIAIAASLHHPHILPLFDSGEAGNLLYFTMPFVDGASLRELLARSGVLPVSDAVRIARQVASGLSYAHARGIIHRDIKPGNILVAGDVAQIADFGIARGLEQAAGDRLTESGLAIGTPTYMSPEQGLAIETLDERSDLYSLGCVLYEMLAGEPPFTGPSVRVIMTRHAMEPVPSLRAARPTIPERLEQTIARALAKEPADRHGSLAELAAELAEIETEARARSGSSSPAFSRGVPLRRPPGGRRGILVLPFLHLSPAAGEEYIGSGLTDEIITSLSGLEALRVISHTSAMQLRGTAKGARELGRELGVHYVLEGSVRRAGDAIRVTTRLVATESEELIWTQGYEGRIGDLFALEKTISRAVVDALAVQLSANERKRLNEHRISDTRAFELYLRARQEVYTFTEPALDRALGYLKQGAALGGDNVVFWAAMGYVYWQYVNAGIRADPAYLQRARDCADRILEIDRESPEARRLLGLIEIHAKGDPQVAVDHLKAALDANPDDPDALFWLSLIYGCVGRPSSGYALAIRLLDIDPLTPLHHVVPGFLDVLDGDPQRALPWLARAHELEPANPITSIAYGQALAMAGERGRACTVLQEIGAAAPDSFFAGLGRTFAHAVQGQPEQAREAMTPDVTENARHDLQYSWTLAQCCAMIGACGEATGWVENAVRQGFWNYPLLAERDPLLKSLREDPRFMALMASTKSKWLHFRV
jgi:eukaryotic-like serine/threonine-protein kinase